MSTRLPAEDRTLMRYAAHALWKQGIRSGDSTIIELMYGFSPQETQVLCCILQMMERTAEARLRYYDPEIGF